MPTGKVTYFNESKGFGFVKSDDGQELFVHVTGTIDQIRVNDDVIFDISQGKKGSTAVNVKLKD